MQLHITPHGSNAKTSLTLVMQVSLWAQSATKKQLV